MGKPSLLIVGLRWFLGLLWVVFSGLAKLIPGFPNSMGPRPTWSTGSAPHGLALFARFDRGDRR